MTDVIKSQLKERSYLPKHIINMVRESLKLIVKTNE